MAKQQKPKTPAKPKKRGEKNAQEECYLWVHNERPELRGLVFSIENEATGGAFQAAKKKAAGAYPGVADMVFLKATDQGHALFIELKTRTGSQSRAQKDWENLISANGYAYSLCRVEPGDIGEFQALIDFWAKK